MFSLEYRSLFKRFVRSHSLSKSDIQSADSLCPFLSIEAYFSSIVTNANSLLNFLLSLFPGSNQYSEIWIKILARINNRCSWRGSNSQPSGSLRITSQVCEPLHHNAFVFFKTQNYYVINAANSVLALDKVMFRLNQVVCYWDLMLLTRAETDSKVSTRFSLYGCCFFFLLVLALAK